VRSKGGKVDVGEGGIKGEEEGGRSGRKRENRRGGEDRRKTGREEGRKQRDQAYFGVIHSRACSPRRRAGLGLGMVPK
jgi:hypothetical protein